MFAGMLQTRREHPVASCPSCSMTAQLHWHAWDDLSSSAPPGILSSGKQPCASSSTEEPTTVRAPSPVRGSHLGTKPQTGKRQPSEQQHSLASTLTHPGSQWRGCSCHADHSIHVAYEIA